MFLLFSGVAAPAAALRQATSTPTATPSPTPAPTVATAARLARPTPTPDLRGGAAALTGDCNNDDQVTIDDLIVGVAIALGTRQLSDCPSLDINADGVVTVEEIIAAVNIALNGPPGPDVTLLVDTSPAKGESGVALTRETVLRFNGPLNAASVTLAAIHADFGGGEVLARLHLSPDGSVATLFYTVPLPASSRIRVTVDGNVLRAANGRAVDADADGQPGGVSIIDFDTLGLAVVAGTAVCGRVFASELVPGGDGTSINEPLAGVTIEVDGNPDLRAVTDQFGDFRLDPAPAGRFFVFIVGSTATNDIPPGAFYPNVGKAWEAIAGRETNIGEIFLPLIKAGTLQSVSRTQETEVRFPDEVVQDFPELADVRLMVPADSLFANDGSRGGMVGIAPVAPDRIPSRLPPGLEFPLVITVQTDGAQNFDKPVPVCFPNLPDPKTGRPLPPGAESALWSFDHDTGQFEIVGPMRVTADGKLVCTEPGVGILAPGWHGSAPGASGGGGPLGGPPGGDGPEKGGDSPPPGAPTKKKCKNNADDDDVVDPVYLFSGEFYEEVDDLRIEGRGVDFVWSRKYRSKIGPNTTQGNGWDFSYNIFLNVDGADVVLCDGNSRRDTYTLGPIAVQGSAAASVVLLTGRTWSRPEFFSDLTLNADGTWTYTFPDGGTWLFNPVDGSTAQGKIRASTDRNGNSLRFSYDGTGRLTTIIDTLDRTITVAYNADGFIESVTDFIGRQVRYEYYQDGDAGGSFGDLKSARSPLITGTPNRNDFPDGKLTTYTYSTGLADDRLNHNLLTITDGRRNDPADSTFGAGPYLRNVYASTTNPDDVDFDRVLRQFWGGPNDVVDMVYVPQTPSAANRQAFMKAIINDRVGNVKEYFFEPGNRVVIKREYTGRAAPDRATTETANRPTSKLRATDPSFFETLYEWNDDALMTRVVHPNGNSVEYVYESDVNPSATPHMRGNVRIRRQLPGPLAASSDQNVIEEQFDYDARFGCGQCGSSFVTRHIDGRGNETLHEYDEHGNRTKTTHRLKTVVDEYDYNQFGQLTVHTLPDNGSGHRRRDEYRYYDSGPQRGYMRQVIADAAGLSLAITFEHDAVGNVIRQFDPRGHDARYDVNALNQMVRATSREVADGSGVRYTRQYAYDANNNVVRIDRQNVDEDGQVRSNAQLTRTFEYELLNSVVRRSDEVDAAHAIVTEYQYDANRNPTLTRFGEATNGNQPGNTRRVLYDERDLVLRVVTGEGTADQSSTQYNYDLNGNRATVRQGLESAPRITTRTHDGYNRLVRLTDPMGDVATWRYDANGNATSARVDGELQDVPGSTGNVRLADVAYTFDPMDRLIQQSEAYFNLQTQAAIGDGGAAKQLSYSGTSQVVRVTNDNAHESRLEYDTADRLHRATDAKGNSTTVDYDANSYVTAVTQVDKADLRGADETFVAGFTYDNLNRLVESVDSAGNVHRFAYDSQNDLVRHTDARGNVTRSTFDGVRRVATRVTDLRDTGEGTGTLTGTLTTTMEWDDSSRLVRAIDDSGHATTYTYDALNRPVDVRYADGTRRQRLFDVHDNPIEIRDANGTVVRSTFDLLDRVVQRSIQPSAGVLGTTAETFAYDGRSDVVAAGDDDATVSRQYDSLRHIIRETLNGETTASAYDGENNQLTCRYPGGRQIQNTYDALERRQTVADDAGQLASYAFVGPTRIQQRDYRNDTRATYAYDSARRITRTTHARISGGAATLDDRSYAWDPMFNKTSRRDLRSGGRRHDYRYDSVQRMVESTLTPSAGAAQSILYTLDGVDNRLRTAGGTDAGDYLLSAVTPSPADAQLNQYTETPFDMRVYDANGNLTAVDVAPLGGAPDVRLAYDYRNQMVQHADARSGVTTTYAYDALGRRIEKVVDDGTPQSTRFFYDRWRVVEEQDGAGTTQATYVYGHYIDDVLTMQRGGSDFFYHTDDMYNVTAVSAEDGSVVERYDYGDYGAPLFSDPAGAPRAGSSIGNPYLFNGRRLDNESGLYEYRTRYLDPRAGRFITRDTLDVWGDPMSRGNGAAYAGSNPFSRLDPLGQCPVLVEVVVVAVEVAGEGAAVGGGEAVLTGTFEQLAFQATFEAGAGAAAETTVAGGVAGLTAADIGSSLLGLGLIGKLGEVIVDLATEPGGSGGAGEAEGDDISDEPTLPGVPVPTGPNGTEPDFPALPSDPNPWDDDEDGQCIEPEPDPTDDPSNDPTLDDQTPISGPDAPDAPAPRPLPDPEPMPPNDPNAPRPLPPTINRWTDPSEAPEPPNISNWTNPRPQIAPGGGGGAVEIPEY